jgi:hypothetical protein
MYFTFFYHATCHFTVVCFICQDLCNMQCVVVILASLVDRLSDTTSAAIQCTASVCNFIQLYIETNIVNLRDPTEWIHLYCTVPYFKILYWCPDFCRCCCCCCCRSGPGANAPVALQPLGLLCYHVRTVATKCLHVLRDARDPSSEGGTLWARIVSDNFA